MKRISILIIIGFVLSVLLIPNIGLATVQTTITFDEPPISTPPPQIGVRYSNSGVLLPKVSEIISLPQRGLPSKPYSWPNVLISRYLGREFDTDPLIIEFTYSVQEVSLYTGVPKDSHGRRVHITLEAFDENDNIVNTMVKDLGVGPNDINVAMQVVAPQMQHIIRKIKLDARQVAVGGEVGIFEFIDDLTITSEGKPPVLAVEPPKVYIKSPVDGFETSTGNITISGEIYYCLFPDFAPPEVEISWPIDYTSTFPSLDTVSLELNKNLSDTPPPPHKLSFAFPYQLSHLGENTITAMASNAKGKGSDQVSVTYFPQSITDEYNKEGGFSTFGNFNWGTTINDCIVAIYVKGAIFSSPAGTYSVFSKIFNKWYSLNSGKLLGCAIGEEKTVSSGLAQDFVKGRIYSGPKGEYYVVEPFRDAIDKLDFISDYGLPVTDPVEQNKSLLPILWQKFERTIGAAYFISVMEVTDNPLTLWIATPDIEGIKRAGILESDITPRIPTVWRSFTCNKIDEPCLNVGKPQLAKKLPYSGLEMACNFSNYPWGSAPQWAHLLPWKKIIPYIGTIKATGLAGEDAPWNHDCSCGGFSGVDWCTHVVPDPGFENILGEKQTTLEIEYEWCLVGYPIPKDYNDPSKGAEENLRPGDKLFVAGRWISDCGCHPWYSCSDPYKSEIHPPAVMINMYTDTYLGKPTTIGEITYFDWWYPGETVEVDIYPPPRPQADASFKCGIPIWTSICPSDGGKCGIQYSPEPKLSPNHLRLKISGRPDVPFHTPPKEDKGNGQLFHGHLLPKKGERLPVDPYYPHTKSLWGDFNVYWGTP